MYKLFKSNTYNIMVAELLFDFKPVTALAAFFGSVTP